MTQSSVSLSEQDIESLRNKLSITFNKNLAYFKEHLPQIFHQFKHYQPQHYGLDLDPQGNINIAANGQFVFKDDPEKICQQQADKFFSNPVKSMYLLVPSAKEVNAFDYIHVDYLVKASDLGIKYRELSKFAYAFGKTPRTPVNRFPFFILIGTGLGYHISKILEQNIDHLYIYEPNEDMFFASLHTIDWKQLFDYFQYEGRSITLTVGSKVKQFIDGLALLSNRFGQYKMSNLTVYKHYDSETANQALQDYINNTSSMYSGYGFCEDEILSLNHTLGNIINERKFLKADFSFDESLKHPVFICGSGPSLDEAIPYLKEHGDKAIIVSCGTSLLALNKNGIKSDIHIEIERTKHVYNVLAANKHQDLMKQSLLIGMNTLHPMVASLFDESVLFLKPNDGSTDFIRTAFPPELAIVFSTNPTVTNGAMGLFNQLKSGDIYMFGCDYGYRNKDNHHSKSSGYYDEYSEDIKKLVDTSGDKKVEANFDGEVYTTTVFSWAKSAIEFSIRNNINPDENKKIFNCSDGAKIEGTESLKIDDIKLNKVVDKTVLRERLLQQATNTVLSEEKWKLELTDRCEHMLETIDRLVDEKYKVENVSSEDVMHIFNRMFLIIREFEGGKNIFTSRMLEGSFTYMSSTILGHMYDMTDEKTRVAYLNESVPLIYQYFIDLKDEINDKILAFNMDRLYDKQYGVPKGSESW